MSQPPLHPIERRLGAEFIPFGPASADEAAPPIELAATFGAYEAEYAAVRRYVGVLHLPQRGLLRVTGADRQDFLHRILTQDIRPMTGGQSRRAFQLNNKGRIVADILVHHGDADSWLETDRPDLQPLRAILERGLFTEDVTFSAISDERAVVALHGPAAAALVNALREVGTPAGEIEPGTHHVLTLRGAPATVCRWDDAGSPALRLYLPAAEAPRLYEALLDAAGYDPDEPADAAAADRRRQSLRGRPIGWAAYNTARIEAGTPVFHIDFGPDSLPAEAGPDVLAQTVSFNKGCYIGQEIVARMRNLGNPKRVLTGLKMQGAEMPIAGAQVFDAADQATVIGAVTSSTLSPLLGNAPIALGMMKWGRHHPGTRVAIPAEGRMAEAEVHAPSFITP